jgi:pyrroloquinoline-quinone synthase
MFPVQPRLLDHPFYQAWTRGEISPDTLAAYHKAYTAFIKRIPSWWSTAAAGAGDFSPLARTIIQEEESHIPLWEAWGKSLPPSASVTNLQSTIDAFALQAFEIQQPDVARTKKEGLLQHYGFSPDVLTYFDEHQREEKHIRFGARLATRVNEKEYKEGFTCGAELIYKSLDAFVGQTP